MGLSVITAAMPPPAPGVMPMHAPPEFDTQFFENQYWVKSIYTPPQEFETTNKNTRKVDLQIGYTPKNPYDGSYDWTAVHYSQKKKDEQDAVTGTTKKVPANQVTVHRPPVLLVHGLWSNSSTWSSDYVNPAPAEGRVVDNGFSYPNAQPFASSVPNLKERIQTELIDKLRRDDKIAATKVDLIAHSMGTLLSRSWLTHPEYRRPDNFQEGDVRKLVAVTAPHWGSQLGNMLINMHQNFPHGVIDSDNPNPIDTLEASLLGDIHQGAICDLAENSPAVGFPGVPDVSGRATTASGGPAGLYWYFNSAVSGLSATQYNEHVRPYGFNVPNDALVAVDSQQAGLPSTNYSDAIHFHTPRILFWYPFGLGITDSAASAKDIYVQLDSAQGFLTELLSVSTFRDGRTRPGIGRGSADISNFALQCTGGGPMSSGTAAAGPQRAQAVKVTAYPSTQPGITITPPSGSVVRPSTNVLFRVDVDPALQPLRVRIWAGMKYGIVPVEIPAPPYETTVAIPTDLTGPVEMYVTVYLPDNKARTASLILYVIPEDAPVRLEINDSLSPGTPIKPVHQLSRTLAVTGIYADGTRRDLKGAALGTTYSSTNPAIATIDTEGVVTPVALGIAFIVTEHRGVRAYTKIMVSERGVPLSPIEHSTDVTIAASGFRLDRETGRFLQELTIRNNSSLPLSKITELVIANLPPGVRLTNSNGQTRVITPIGSPYRSVSVTGAKFFLPGATQSVLLAFTNDHGVPITYSARLFTASNP